MKALKEKATSCSPQAQKDDSNSKAGQNTASIWEGLQRRLNFGLSGRGVSKKEQDGPKDVEVALTV